MAQNAAAQGQAAVQALFFGNFSGLQPPAYHGKPHEDVLLWLFQLDSYKLIKNLNDAQLLIILGSCMQGDALEWWAGVRYNILTYAAFQAGVKARFGESESLLMTKVMNIKQNKEETVCHYVDRFRRLVIQAGYPDAGRKKLFISGLNDSFKSRVRSHRNPTLDKAISMAIDFEDDDIEDSPERVKQVDTQRKRETDSDVVREAAKAVKGTGVQENGAAGATGSTPPCTAQQSPSVLQLWQERAFC